ncbi:MAG: type II secretion system protein N [Aquabacterium sp.]
MLSKTLMFLVWALVAGSSVFWGFKLMAQPLAVPANAAVAVQAPAAVGDLSGLLGVRPAAAVQAAEAAPPPPPESSRFQLVGVVAARHAARAQGVALIAVDGKLARAYRVGAVIERDLVLQSVESRVALIGPRGGVAVVTLELPPLPPPTTGVPGAAPGVPPPGMTALPNLAPQGLPLPQAVQPGAVPPFQAQQQRLRAARTFGAPPAGMPMPGVAQPQQEESMPDDGRTRNDPRNLR